jgi:hypothetical protein
LSACASAIGQDDQVLDQGELNPKLVVRASPIAGLGLFAVEPVERDEVCCRLGGRVMTDDEFGRHILGRERYSALAIDEGINLVQADHDLTTKGNHSCDPNMWLADAVTVVARRAIAVGEEATIDYALLTVDRRWTMRCYCRRSLCRHTVTGSDWQLRELQTKYDGHWSPFIQRRIDDGFTRA